MASLATPWMEDQTAMAAAFEAPREDSFQIRPFPGEDVYFWTKSIDNARVDQRNDPAFLNKVWRMVTVALVVAIFGLGFAAPAALRVMAGIEAQKLEKQLHGLQLAQRELALRLDAKRSPVILDRPGASPWNYSTPRNDVHLPPVAGPRFNAHRSVPAPARQ